jgi:hypothetical protein
LKLRKAKIYNTCFFYPMSFIGGGKIIMKAIREIKESDAVNGDTQVVTAWRNHQDSPHSLQLSPSSKIA